MYGCERYDERMEDFLNLRLYYSFISNKSLSITKVTATSNYHLRNAI